MRKAIGRARVRIRGGGLQAAFKSVRQTERSPLPRSRHEDGVSGATEVEERADDLAQFAFVEEVLSLEDEESAKA